MATLPPQFSVGATDGKRAGILLEDLSKGGTVELEHQAEKPYGFMVKDGKRVPVFIDLDAAFESERDHPFTHSQLRRPEGLRYFAKGNFIRL